MNGRQCECSEFHNCVIVIGTMCKNKKFLLITGPFGRYVNCNLLELAHSEDWSSSSVG